ncbi:Tetratricopeptide repeat protein 8 [Chamberlinius hualienensis]
MDEFYLALSLFKRRKYEKCSEICSKLLERNQLDQAVWVLKMKALTSQVYVDDSELDEDGMADCLLEDNAIAQMPRPGTSLNTPKTSQSSHIQSFRPVTTSGRPLSGIVHPGTRSGRSSSLEQAIQAPRTAHTARPVTSASGRFIRLRTASTMTSPGGPFINLARLNLTKYASNPYVAKPLFEYIYYHENDIRMALRLAAEATQQCQFKDWWWKVQVGKCYYKLGSLRDAEKQFLSALKQQDTVECYLHLAKVYIRMDQPLTAVELYNAALEKFPGETTLLIGLARIYEALDDLLTSVNTYKFVLLNDATNVEAIACLATHHFYSDQPEVAMRFYRRLLQMGVYNSEVFANLGLCCFYAQQFDLSLTCFERALALSDSDITRAEIWYNLSHIALSIGDTTLAYQCLRLTLVMNGDHAEAYNNMAYLEHRKKHVDSAKALMQTSINMGAHLYEPLYNLSYLSEKTGDLQTSYQMAKKALQLFPNHSDSQSILNRLQEKLSKL